MTAVLKHLKKTSAVTAIAESIDLVERDRCLAAVVAVDVLEQIHRSRVFYEQGHANARVMYQHLAGVSGAEAHRLDKVRRMIGECDQINSVWRNGDLGIDKAALLANAFANPRTRERFVLDQRWFLKQASRFGFVRLKNKVAHWIEVHDTDGSPPEADPSFQRRTASCVQEFNKAWRLDAVLGSLQGSRFNQILRAYAEAEFHHDWAAAEQVHGADTCMDLLERTHNQRMADALCQLAEDAVNSDKPAASVQRVHNIVWNAETYEELLRRWVDGPARLLDPDTYNITDLDGHPLVAGTAFADSLVQSVRRVVQNAAGITINMGAKSRLFTGLARLGVQLTTTECYWPGCHVPTSRCQIDHLRPAARDARSRVPCSQSCLFSWITFAVFDRGERPMTSDLVLVERHGAVAVITLNRPEVRNALNAELRQQLYQALIDANTSNAAAIVLTGADPAFCAGLDLKALAADGLSSGPGAGQSTSSKSPFPPLDKPLIGAINGVAVTGGLELALRCDFLIGSENARFADTHALVGVMPGWGLTVALPQAIGIRRARQMSFTGNYVDATLAMEWGLLNEVVPHRELLERAIAIGNDMATIAPSNLAGIRNAYVAAAEGHDEPALTAEATYARKWASSFDPAVFAEQREMIQARGRAQQGD